MKENDETGVNFINVKHAHFSYERLFSSYVLALKEFLHKKFTRLTLMKLTAGVFGRVSRQLKWILDNSDAALYQDHIANSKFLYSTHSIDK